MNQVLQYASYKNMASPYLKNGLGKMIWDTVTQNSKLLWENDFIFKMSLLKLPMGIGLQENYILPTKHE